MEGKGDYLPRWEHEDTGPTTLVSELGRHERERVLHTTRIPSDLFFRLKQLAIRSTLQILTEHAYTLYLGGRVPPDLWGAFGWPDETSVGPAPDYLQSRLRQFSVRIPRSLDRWAKVFAVQAEISDQELAVKVFDWYVRKGFVPPPKEDVRRSLDGLIVVDEPLPGLKFYGYDEEEIVEAIRLIDEQHVKFRGRPGELLAPWVPGQAKTAPPKTETASRRHGPR